MSALYVCGALQDNWTGQNSFSPAADSDHIPTKLQRINGGIFTYLKVTFSVLQKFEFRYWYMKWGVGLGI